MKHTIILVFIMASASAFPSKEINSQNLVNLKDSRGRDAVTGQFPYQVAVLANESDTTNLYCICGGSVLNNVWVLTAAHCVVIAREVKVLLGVVSLTSAEVIHVVSDHHIIIHKNYDAYTLENDIALIKIPYTDYSTNIQPVSLPDRSRFYADYNGESVIASGWVKTGGEKDNRGLKLQWARLYVASNSVCDRDFKIYPSSICTATIDGDNICDGYSGGPLILESTKTQIGVTSFGNEKCTAAIPAGYTRITSYLEWIKNHTTDTF